MIPLSTAKKRVLGVNQANAGSVGTIMVQATGPSTIHAAQEQVRLLLRQRHHLQPAQEDDFTIRNLEEVFAAQETSARVMAWLLAVVASVSLIVGGIGIMNIMLVSVTERTREIGLRQAVGASTGDILLQFLTEAVAISLLGGHYRNLSARTAAFRPVLSSRRLFLPRNPGRDRGGNIANRTKQRRTRSRRH